MIYRFAEFEVDSGNFLFRAGGEQVQLEPKVLKLLLYMLENRNRLVRKQELLDALWPDAAVTENALTRVVGLLRKAIGDDSQNPRFLQTVPTVGYRFDAEVEIVPITSPSQTEVAKPAESAGAVHKNWKRWLAGAIMLAVVAVVLVGVRRHFALQQMSPTPPALLVLPLQNTGPAQDAYLADSITEELTTSLAQYHNLSVVSSTTARQLGKLNGSIAEIRKQVNVTSVLEGSVMREAGRVRVDLRLIDAAKDRQVWSERFEQDDAKIPELPNRVSQEVTASMRVRLTSDDSARLAVPQTTNAEAYDAYLRGRYLYLRWVNGAGDGDDENPEAIRAFDTAIQLDPGFAEAYALLAQVHELDLHRGFGDVKAHFQRSYFLANKALSLNPRSALAHDVLGALYTERAGDFSWEAGANEFKTAMALDPSDTEAHGRLGILYIRTGLLEKGAEQTEIAYHLDPSFEFFKVQKVQVLEYQQRFQEAYDLCLDFRSRYGCLLDLWETGRHDEAWATMQEVQKDPAKKSHYYASYAFDAENALFLANRGAKAEAEKVIEDVLRRANRKNDSNFTYSEYTLGTAYAVLGEDSKAMGLLNSAAQNGLPCYPLYANDPELTNIRKNPAFIELLERLRKQNERFRATL